MNAICWTEFKVSDIGDTVELRGLGWAGDKEKIDGRI